MDFRLYKQPQDKLCLLLGKNNDSV